MNAVSHRQERRTWRARDYVVWLVLWIVFQAIVIALLPSGSWSLWVEAVTLLGTALVALVLVALWRRRS